MRSEEPEALSSAEVATYDSAPWIIIEVRTLSGGSHCDLAVFVIYGHRSTALRGVRQPLEAAALRVYRRCSDTMPSHSAPKYIKASGI